MLDRVPLSPGFQDPVFDSQATFRSVMSAMARPGHIEPVAPLLRPPGPLNPAAAALLLTLADFETPVWVDEGIRCSETALQWIRFHTGARVTKEMAESRFAILSDSSKPVPLQQFFAGRQDYPDESTTVILQVAAIETDTGPVLTGPGIETSLRLNPKPLSATFWVMAVENAGLFPRGLDFLFAAKNAVAALPRSTQIELEG
ncbi:MAG: phosphonate C-P lyase system protein PhnH [Pseudomonadota bacterium]